MTPTEFINRWKAVELTERSASQQHFLDLCALVGHYTPAQIDPTGESFTFERGAEKMGGGDGWADVWKKDHFAWEYKGKKKDLDAAYLQLQKYRVDLENPPLLVVCDLDRIRIHTNFIRTKELRHEIALEELGTPANLEILRNLFFDPDKLHPTTLPERITEEAARRIAVVADKMRERGLDAQKVARFLDRIIFCLFAEDVELLPKGLFTKLLTTADRKSDRFRAMASGLMETMAKGGFFGADEIRYFNGHLFDDVEVLDLEPDELQAIRLAARLDWSKVDPSIFGTLFERGLDPARRSQLGAHYTSRQDIETLVEPVVMQPLRREWAEVQAVIHNLMTTGKKQPNGKVSPGFKPTPKIRQEANSIFLSFLARLQRVKVLDPACGSGNFLYVTLQKLKDLELEVSRYGTGHGFTGSLETIGPWQLYGLEINEYAFELAQMVVWIGYLQWVRANGLGLTEVPVLRPMEGNFRLMDAILDLSDPAHPKEPEWPRVDYVVGNPPFLGDKLMRGQLGDEYVEQVRCVYAGRLPGQSDLCCYWFERARKEIASGNVKRAGLLATQGIRGGANREVLKAIKESGDIFFAVSDRAWTLDGANVHVSMAAFDNGTEICKILDENPVSEINPNLTSITADTGTAKGLSSSKGIAFVGTTKKAPLDIDESTAIQFFHSPNPNLRPNSDVVVPYLNAIEVTGRPRNQWIIDFPIHLSEEQASQYQSPFEHTVKHVRPLRENHREPVQSRYWWRLARPCPDLLMRIHGLSRFIVTPYVSKYRLFTWVEAPTNPDHTVIAVVRHEDHWLGMLQARPHQVWGLHMGTRLETRPRYTPTTCFETFPFPQLTLELEAAIASAANELNRLRNTWMNPPEWTREEVLEFPGSVDGPWRRFVHEPNAQGIGTVRYPRIVPKDAESAAMLAKRTLTNLYNENPTWLRNAHRALDEAVFAAYGWSPGLTDDELLAKLLELNLERAAAGSASG